MRSGSVLNFPIEPWFGCQSPLNLEVFQACLMISTLYGIPRAHLKLCMVADSRLAVIS